MVKINSINPVKIRITFKSPQVVGYVINIEDNDLNAIEKYVGDSKNNNWKDIDLTSSPTMLNGNFIQGFFSIADPVGKGNKILFTIEVFQDGKSIFSSDLSGTSTGEIDRLNIREQFNTIMP